MYVNSMVMDLGEQWVKYWVCMNVRINMGYLTFDHYYELPERRCFCCYIYVGFASCLYLCICSWWLHLETVVSAAIANAIAIGSAAWPDCPVFVAFSIWAWPCKRFKDIIMLIGVCILLDDGSDSTGMKCIQSLQKFVWWACNIYVRIIFVLHM